MSGGSIQSVPLVVEPGKVILFSSKNRLKSTITKTRTQPYTVLGATVSPSQMRLTHLNPTWWPLADPQAEGSCSRCGLRDFDYGLLDLKGV